jgi:hypothetical protein
MCACVCLIILNSLYQCYTLCQRQTVTDSTTGLQQADTCYAVQCLQKASTLLFAPKPTSNGPKQCDKYFCVRWNLCLFGYEQCVVLRTVFLLTHEDGLSQKSVSNCHYSLRNKPEERSFCFNVDMLISHITHPLFHVSEIRSTVALRRQRVALALTAAVQLYAKHVRCQLQHLNLPINRNYN